MKDDEDLLREIADAAAREAALRAELLAAEQVTGAALAAAHDRLVEQREARKPGLTWAALSEAAQLDTRAAQHRLEKFAASSSGDTASVGLRPSRAGVPQHGTTTGAPEGTLTIAEAARRLGYASRQSVLDLIELGRLEEVVTERPGKRPSRRVTAASVAANPRFAAGGSAISYAAAAKRLGVSRKKVLSLVDAGLITPLPRATGRPGVSVSSLDDYERQREGSVSVSDAARILDVSRDTVYRMIDAGSLMLDASPGGSRRVTRESIAERIEAAEQSLEPNSPTITVAQAAEFAGVTRAAIYAAVKRGQLSRDEDGSLLRQEVSEYAQNRRS